MNTQRATVFLDLFKYIHVENLLVDTAGKIIDFTITEKEKNKAGVKIVES